MKAATGEVVTGEELGGAVVLSHGLGWNIVLVGMGFHNFQGQQCTALLVESPTILPKMRKRVLPLQGE